MYRLPFPLTLAPRDLQADLSEEWLKEAEKRISGLPLRRGQRLLWVILSRKVREIHTRFSRFYRPYARHPSWLLALGARSAEPETLLLPTRWLLKKHPAVAAEFRSLETSIARISRDEVAPLHLLEAGLLLESYIERTAFRFSEETLASTINDWQNSTGIRLSLAETEMLSPLLRLFALDKLSATAQELTGREEARAEARRSLATFGPDHPRLDARREHLRKRRGDIFARAFAESLKENLSREFDPLSRFRPAEKGKERIVSARPVSEDTRNISTRVRIRLRALPLLGEFEWNTLLKKTSTLHRLLVRDPANVYARMTSFSQESYRKKASAVAHILRIPEETLLETALELAESNNESPRNHIGFFLLGDGLPLLIQSVSGNDHLPWWHWYHDRLRLPTLQSLYFKSICVGSAGTSIAFMIVFLHFKWLVLFLIPIIYKSFKHIADTFFSGAVSPTLLPRLNFRSGIPDSAHTVFVIPSLLKDEKTLRSLTGKLETAFLSNRAGTLSFCLLLDFPDAKEETLPGDTVLLEATRAAFRELNTRYGTDDRFWFVLRSRVWSPRQERWMGWERKRGKLLDFARMLRGRPASSPFIVSRTVPSEASFVVTIDEDAFIPRDFIKNIIGIHAHPLQRPILREKQLISGFTFIQPHVKQWFKNRHRFRLPRIFFDEKRFSAYTNVFPEIYQDLFSEGSYAGKGSFHIDGFLAALDGTLPPDQILSHDLLEGSFGRTAYAADIDLFDEFPKSLRALLSRSHRWTRGDWQIVDWLFRNVREESGKKTPNTLQFIHRFKIADNLLQSLFRPAVFLLTILSWAIDNGALFLFVWGLFLSELFFIDFIIDWTRWIAQFISGRWKHVGYRLRKTLLRTARLLRQTLFECATLPFSALDTMHAIATATFRRLWNGKHMLEWIPSAHSEQSAGKTPLLFPLLTLSILFASIRFGYSIHPFFLVLLALWTALPLIVFILNRPYTRHRAFSRKDEEGLRRDALETWSFFEAVIRPKTHFLPPDSVRFAPDTAVAHYTSITNIGFSLLSTIVAHRFGFLSRERALKKLNDTISTLERLERFRGHFYNWYNVETALPAPPPFISSVDSGNLLASLITVRQWLLKKESAPDPVQTLRGLRDMVHLIAERIPKTLAFQSFADFWGTLLERVDSIPDTSSYESVIHLCGIIRRHLSGFSTPHPLPDETKILLDSVRARIEDIHSEATAPKNSSLLSIELARRLDTLIAEMRFDFLKSGKRGLISIGFHVPSKRIENRFYQTLASEARVTSFLALAEGTLSFRGWNKLNRTVLPLPEGPALISWTGTLFEYLMPALFLEEHTDSLVGRSIRTAIRMNIRFAKKQRLPIWGLSESGYAELDRGGSYRYKPFGLPALSLSPSADDRPVVSAYAIALSLPFFPKESIRALDAYTRRGGRTPFGFIESIDFFRSRHGSPVRMCMSHHQGMILAAIGNSLFDHFLSRLFESHPLVQNSLFVLDESVPPIDKEPFPRPIPTFLKSGIIHPRTP